MTDISKIVKDISEMADCTVYPQAGLPTPVFPHTLPQDVFEFYQVCGGLELFSDSARPFRIFPPQEVVQANYIIFIGLSEEELAPTKEELSWSWYMVAEGLTGLYIGIDFDRERLGRCYYGFWDSFGMKGHSPIIALSFSEFLTNLVASKGEYLFWEHPNFKTIGDAYD